MRCDVTRSTASCAWMSITDTERPQRGLPRGDAPVGATASNTNDTDVTNGPYILLILRSWQTPMTHHRPTSPAVRRTPTGRTASRRSHSPRDGHSLLRGGGRGRRVQGLEALGVSQRRPRLHALRLEVHEPP